MRVNFFYVMNLGFDFVVMHRYSNDWGGIIEKACGLFHSRDDAIKAANEMYNAC